MAAQGGKGGAQAGASGFEVHIGPQQFDEFFARVATVHKQGEVPQQNRCLLGPKPGHFLLRGADSQLPQKVNSEGLIHISER